MNRDEMYQMYLEALEEMKYQASLHDFSPNGDDLLIKAMAKFNLYRTSLISFDSVEAAGKSMSMDQVFQAVQYGLSHRGLQIRPMSDDRNNREEN